MSLHMKYAKSRYQGDPGLFGVIGKVLGGAAKTVGGLLPGPVGGAVSKVGGLLGGGGGGAIALPRSLPGIGIGVGTGYTLGGGMPTNFTKGCGAGRLKIGGKCITPGDAFPGGGDFITNAPGSAVGCPSGYHPNKSGYWLKDGTYVQPKSKCVKNRRRNVANVRALDRAISRLEGAKRLQHKLRGFSTPKYTAAGTKKNCK